MSTFYDESVDEQVREQIFKIIIIGDSNVGKTCLAYRFCTGKFPERTEATIGVDFCEKKLTIDGENLKLQIWDTAGQERFRKSMVGHYYRNVSAVVFMYDITRKGSFEALSIWLDEYGNYAYGGNVPKIIIGNKCDLGKERTVNSNDARKFADIHNMPLWEISTKNDEELATINSIFLTLAHKLVKQKPMMEPVMEHYLEENSATQQRTRVSSNIYEVVEKSKKTIKLKKQNSKREKKCCKNGS